MAFPRSSSSLFALAASVLIILAAPFAGQVVADVDHDAAEPRSNARLPVETFDGAIEFHERFLYGVFRVLAIARDVVRDTLEARRVHPVKLFERTDLLPPARGQQFALSRVFLRVHRLEQRQYRWRRQSNSHASWTMGEAESLEKFSLRGRITVKPAVTFAPP